VKVLRVLSVMLSSGELFFARRRYMHIASGTAQVRFNRSLAAAAARSNRLERFQLLRLQPLELRCG